MLILGFTVTSESDFLYIQRLKSSKSKMKMHILILFWFGEIWNQKSPTVKEGYFKSLVIP